MGLMHNPSCCAAQADAQCNAQQLNQPFTTAPQALLPTRTHQQRAAAQQLSGIERANAMGEERKHTLQRRHRMHWMAASFSGCTQQYCRAGGQTGWQLDESAFRAAAQSGSRRGSSNSTCAASSNRGSSASSISMHWNRSVRQAATTVHVRTSCTAGAPPGLPSALRAAPASANNSSSPQALLCHHSRNPPGRPWSPRSGTSGT